MKKKSEKEPLILACLGVIGIAVAISLLKKVLKKEK